VAGTVRLYVTSTLANLPASLAFPACLQRWHVWIGWSVRSSGSLAGWLASFLPSHVHLARPPIFALLTQTPPLVCFRAALLRSPYLLPFLSRYPSLPFLSLACSRRIAALYLLLEAFAFSVFGWWDSDIDEGGGGGGGGEGESRRRRRRRRRKGGSFCLLDT